MVNSLKFAFRALRKNAFYTTLNVFGLSIGIAAGLILFLFIHYHLSFDRYHRKEDRIFRVVTTLHLDDGSIKYEKGAPIALANAIHVAIPQVKDQAFLFTNFRDHSFTVTVPTASQSNKKLFAEHSNVAFADHHWFALFDYQWQAGDPLTSLEELNTAVLTKNISEKYFGNENPIGKTINLDGIHEVKITGVLKDRTNNTDTKADIFISLISLKNFYPEQQPSMQSDWGWINSSNGLYLLLREGVKSSDIAGSLTKLKNENIGELAKYYQFHLIPLKELHFDLRYGGIIPQSLLIMLALVGFFIVVIACVNFINLATSQNARRAKEISTRKILGSTGAAIFWQFIVETAFITLLSVFLSFAWVFLTLPMLNTWLHSDLQFTPFKDSQLIGILLTLVTFIILTAGIYPALLLTRFKPVDALMTRSATSRQPWLAKSLILLQNTVAQSLIICTLIIVMQNNFIKTANLGFNKESVIMVPLPNADKSNLMYLRNQLLAKSGVQDASFCFRAPSSEVYKAGSVKFDNRDWESYSALSILGDSHYVTTFGLHLIAGRNLVESDTTNEFLVTEDFVRKLGYKNASDLLGHRIVAGALKDHAGTIVGIVDDIHLRSLRNNIEPLLISSSRESYAYAGIKLNGVDAFNTIAAVKYVWQKVYPENIFEYQFLDEQIGEFYKNEDLLNKLIGTFAVLAIIITCVGLLGLISLLTIQRTKEIGIRKVIGASVLNITMLLTKEFARLVGFAILLSGICCWLIMNNWLKGFAYRIEIPWWIFVVAGLSNLLLVIFTISFHSIKAALMNPVKTLRMD